MVVAAMIIGRTSTSTREAVITVAAHARLFPNLACTFNMMGQLATTISAAHMIAASNGSMIRYDR